MNIKREKNSKDKNHEPDRKTRIKKTETQRGIKLRSCKLVSEDQLRKVKPIEQ